MVGRWKSTSLVEQEYRGGELVNEESELCTDWYLGLDLNSGGTGQIIEHDDEDATTDIQQINWTVMSGKLMVSVMVDGRLETESMDIVEVKNRSLVLSYTEEFRSGGEDCKFVEIFYFTKL